MTQAKIYRLKDNSITITHSDIPAGGYVLRVRDMPSEQKPREKMLSYGPSFLSLPELVAVLLGTGTRKEEVMSMSKRILKEYGEKAISAELSPRRLAELVEIPLTKASQIVAALEIGRRFYSQRQGKPAYIKLLNKLFSISRICQKLERSN